MEVQPPNQEITKVKTQQSIYALQAEKIIYIQEDTQHLKDEFAKLKKNNTSLIEKITLFGDDLQTLQHNITMRQQPIQQITLSSENDAWCQKEQKKLENLEKNKALMEDIESNIEKRKIIKATVNDFIEYKKSTETFIVNTNQNIEKLQQNIDFNQLAISGVHNKIENNATIINNYISSSSSHLQTLQKDIIIEKQSNSKLQKWLIILGIGNISVLAFTI